MTGSCSAVRYSTISKALRHTKARRNVYSFASRDEIAAEVDRLMDEFRDKCMDKFNTASWLWLWRSCHDDG